MSMMVNSSRFGGAPAASTLWRIVWPDGMLGNGDDVRVISLQMRETVGGSDVAAGSTTTASQGTTSNLYDGNASTYCEMTTGTGAWIQCQFGAAKTINEVVIGVYNYELNNFRVEWWDGSAWQLYWSDGPYLDTSFQAAYTFARPGVTGALYKSWRLRFPSGAPAGALTCTECEMRATSGGADQCAGGTASVADTSTTAANAFDNSTATDWNGLAAGNTGGWLRYDFPSAVAVTEVSYRGHASQPTRGPSAVDVQYHDGTQWQTLWSVSSLSWSNGETKVWTKP